MASVTVNLTQYATQPVQRLPIGWRDNVSLGSNALVNPAYRSCSDMDSIGIVVQSETMPGNC